MDIQPIRAEEDYEEALREIARLMDAEPGEGTEEFDKLDILATLVEAYESKHHVIDSADPVETIEFQLERLGWTQAELAKRAGIQASHLSAVLNRRRKLSLKQIQKLSALFEISADRLIDNPYADESSRPRV